LSLTALVWGAAPVLVKLLQPYFDPLTQSFFRYLTAGLSVLFLCGFAQPQPLRQAAIQWPRLLLPAAIVAIHQILFVEGLYRTSAVVSSLIGKTSAVFIPVLAYLFLAEERHIVRHPRFLWGTGWALTGVVGIVLGQPAPPGENTLLGAGILLVSMLAWSVYAVMTKPLVHRFSPLVITGVVPLLACIYFTPFLLVQGQLHQIRSAPPDILALLFGSGALVIGVGNAGYYHALRHVGPSLATSFLLITPLVAWLMSCLTLQERLTSVQIAFSGLLLLGCFLISRVTLRPQPLARGTRPENPGT